MTALVAAACLLLGAPASAGRGPAEAVRAVATVRVVDGDVQRRAGGTWKAAGRDFGIGVGDAIRTGHDGLALVILPWAEILVGRDAEVGLAPSRVLSAVLERGRIRQRAPVAILKIKTPEAEVRGRGDVVVRRSDEVGGLTRVSSLDGAFRVRAGKRTVALGSGEGVLVAGGAAAPDPGPLPAVPRRLVPGADPAYVERGKTLRLAWTGTAPRYYVEVSTLTGDEIVLTADVSAAEMELRPTWLGTFRYRVSAVDERGVEGAPSAPGLFCVVEK